MKGVCNAVPDGLSMRSQMGSSEHRRTHSGVCDAQWTIQVSSLRRRNGLHPHGKQFAGEGRDVGTLGSWRCAGPDRRSLFLSLRVPDGKESKWSRGRNPFRIPQRHSNIRRMVEGRSCSWRGIRPDSSRTHVAGTEARTNRRFPNQPSR